MNNILTVSFDISHEDTIPFDLDIKQLDKIKYFKKQYICKKF